MKKLFRKTTGLLLALVLSAGLLSGCGKQYEEYRGTFITVQGIEVFDTVFTVLAWEKSQEDWLKHYGKIQELVLKYHKLFDFYHEYEGINNILTINKNAGKAPVVVDKSIIGLIKTARDLYHRTGEKTNIAMGAVTEIWHVAREHNISSDGDTMAEADMIIPKEEDLAEAAKHIDFDKVVVDEAASTVYLEDPQMRLDVGALAKGYATELIADELSAMGMENGLMSSGGNIKSIGAPDTPEKKNWGVGITDPLNPQQTLPDRIIKLDGKQSVVSSGDYERYFVYQGRRYHHIIDPLTLQPGGEFSQVTVITEDSGEADFLSTTLFLLPYEKSAALADELGIGAVWVWPDGRQAVNAKAEAMFRD